MTFPVHRGPAAEAIRAFDWSSTSLGEISTWPSTLRTIVNLILESEFPKALVWGTEMITIHNDAFMPILGDKPSAMGRSFADIWSEAWESIGPIAEKAFGGHSTYIENFPLMIERGRGPEQAYFTFCYSPVRDDDGVVLGMMDTVIETTQTVLAQQTEAVLRRELAHRVKNSMAVTSAVVNSTLRHAPDLETAKASIGERIDALSRAQDFSGEGDDVSDLEHLIRQVTGPHIEDWGRVSMSGPSVSVQSRQVLALSLVMYELATNAVKHGAMASPNGTIAIEWLTDAEGEFSFKWTEKTDRPVSTPTRRGFGSQLTTRIGPAYFAGEGRADYAVDGLSYVLRGRLDREANL